MSRNKPGYQAKKEESGGEEGQEEVGTLWSGFEEMSYAVLRNLSLELSV